MDFYLVEKKIILEINGPSHYPFANNKNIIRAADLMKKYILEK